MGTGFSRPEQPHFGPDFGGVENDLAAFGEFIRGFLNEYNLWGSPLLWAAKAMAPRAPRDFRAT
jgi:carboxypeptidase C (cathepsin A)